MAANLMHDVYDPILARLFDAALDAVIGMNAEGAVLAWNRQAELTFGWSREDALSQPLASLIIPDELRQAHTAGLHRYLQTGEAAVLNKRIEIEAINRAGVRFPVELTIIPLGERGSESFFAFLRDITARREHEDRIKQRALETEVLWEASLKVASGGTLEDLFGSCLARICRVTGWSAGHVYLPDDLHHPTRLLPSPVWHFENEALAPIARESERFAFRSGEGLPGRIWASGTPEWIPDISDAANLSRMEILLSYGLHAAFGFPIYSQGRLQAVLEFFSGGRQPPDQHLMYVIQSLGHQLGRVIERHRAQEQQLLLVRELSHRVGNSLAVLQSVFRRSAAHAKTVEELRQSFEDRLMSIAAAHKLLAQGEWNSANLGEIVRAAVSPYCSQSLAHCHLSGPDLRLPAALVMPLTMILHELATNAAKHGAFRNANGKVDVSWHEQSDSTGTRRLTMDWRERDVSAPPVEVVPGYGTTLISSTVDALGGSAVREFTSDGLSVQITIPSD